MDLSRCEKGHFFDKEKFPVCPHCQGSETLDDQMTSVFTEDITEPITEPITNDAPVSSVTDEEKDHTFGFFDDEFFGTPATPASTSATIAGETAPIIKKLSSPCVGWLVALSGAHIGTDFRLKEGKNFVGRDPKMDVALIGDKSVSRNRHAIIVYEPKEHLYLVQPGEASTLVYKNNEVVLTPMKLSAYDLITVGDVNLLFMPLCNKNFNWSALLQELKNL